MEIRVRNYYPEDYGIRYMQEGGAMEDPNAGMAPEEAPMPEGGPEGAPQGGGSPEEQLMMACQEAVQTQNCEIALQVCQVLLQMMGGGGGAAAPQAPEGAAPVYRRGGKFSRWIRK